MKIIFKISFVLLLLVVLTTSCRKEEPKQGCMDPAANNYDSLATKDDGSCDFEPIIGYAFQGGIVFYVDGNGGGLIAATTDQSTGIEWGCYEHEVNGADGTAVGTGYQNTLDIDAASLTTAIDCPNSPPCAYQSHGECLGVEYANDVCVNLTLNGYSDWFLPSKDELNLMHQNLTLNGYRGFSYEYYWSSTKGEYYWEPSDGGYWWSTAWAQSIGHNGHQTDNGKANANYVRAVRAF
jgi:hypothetical protein